MPKKSDRVAPLPAGLLPLIDQKQLETYYGVSDWQVLQWIKQGLPQEPYAGRGRRFDLAKVRDWMTSQSEQLAPTG
jgi:phage terminase Nu1 subunit (DNA packaging protein)